MMEEVAFNALRTEWLEALGLNAIVHGRLVSVDITDEVNIFEGDGVGGEVGDLRNIIDFAILMG